MFLDPAPIGHNKSNNGPPSPSFGLPTPVSSPHEQNFRIKRTPLKELSPTYKNQQTRRSTSTGEEGKPTIRLVGNSSVSTPKQGSDSEHVASQNQVSPTAVPAPPRTSLLVDDVKPTSAAEAQHPAASRVSEEQADIARAQKLDLPPAVTLLPTTHSATVPEPFRTRRSTSSKYSGSGTSHDTDGVDSSFTGSSSSRTGRLSDRTTLYEEEIPESEDEEKEGPRPGHLKAPALETVHETSTERSTAPSVSSVHQLKDSNSTRGLRSPSLDHSGSQSRSHPALPWAKQNIYSVPHDSLGSLPASSLSLPSSPPRVFTGQDSQETLAEDSFAYPETSSPNFIAYPTSSGPHSLESPLHNASSFDSVEARLGTSYTFRRNASPDVSPCGSPISHERSPSADSLPPLYVAKKREQDDSHMSSQSMNEMDDIDYEEIDLEPWPRQPFSSHLSTIASESDRAMSPAQFSHFSMGSGVLTIDDACSIPMSSHMSRHSGHMSNFSMRRASEPLQTPSTKSTPMLPECNEDEAGDMTMGVFRAESAKPEPLFRGRQVTPGGDVRYDGPLPPLPPMPASQSGDENGDSLSALSAPSLKKKRSGYSVRGRSNSTPSGSISRHNSVVSYTESERWSKGSSLFPIWAKNFYGGYAALLSASKISLSNPPTPKAREHPGHVRNPSQWTERSITSRLGTGYSELDNGSPTSSHFLPSIFRPRTRTLGASDNETRSFKFGSKTPKRKQSNPSRPDSMAITSDPYPPAPAPAPAAAQAQSDPSYETLPSGHPKFGTLKGESPQQGSPMPPLPRKYSKQKLWNEMTFPRPMTKDRLSDFKMDVEDSVQDSPHLRPNRHHEAQVNKWRSPSFVESLDTLFSSRGNRQILLFAVGFLCPFFWLLAALLPLPPRHARDASEAEKALPNPNAESEDDLKAALNKHVSGDARLRWEEERTYQKAKWWRTLNRIMCFVGVGILAAVVSHFTDISNPFDHVANFHAQIALAVVAATR